MSLLRLRRDEATDHTPDEADNLFAEEFTQVGSSFAVGDMVLFDQPSGDWIDGQANAVATLPTAVVVMASGTTFSVLSLNGIRYNSPAHGFTPNARLYSSQTVGAAQTATRPSTGIILATGRAHDANWINLNIEATYLSI